MAARPANIWPLRAPAWGRNALQGRLSGEALDARRGRRERAREPLGVMSIRARVWEWRPTAWPSANIRRTMGAVSSFRWRSMRKNVAGRRAGPGRRGARRRGRVRPVVEGQVDRRRRLVGRHPPQRRGGRHGVEHERERCQMGERQQSESRRNQQPEHRAAPSLAGRGPSRRASGSAARPRRARPRGRSRPRGVLRQSPRPCVGAALLAGAGACLQQGPQPTPEPGPESRNERAGERRTMVERQLARGASRTRACSTRCAPSRATSSCRPASRRAPTPTRRSPSACARPSRSPTSSPT